MLTPTLTGLAIFTLRILHLPWGQQAKNRLQQLLPPATKVKLRAIETDRYKRLVAEIFTFDNRSINTNLVQEGNAIVYRQYLKGCSPQLQQSLLGAETAAKQRRLGIWSQDNFSRKSIA